MALIEVKYFNSFTLRKSIAAETTPPTSNEQLTFFGSRGIPSTIGGFGYFLFPPITGVGASSLNWAIEESRIRGGYNNTSVSLGAKAYLVEDEP